MFRMVDHWLCRRLFIKRGHPTFLCDNINQVQTNTAEKQSVPFLYDGYSQRGKEYRRPLPESVNDSKLLQFLSATFHVLNQQINNRLVFLMVALSQTGQDTVETQKIAFELLRPRHSRS